MFFCDGCIKKSKLILIVFFLVASLFIYFFWIGDRWNLYLYSAILTCVFLSATSLDEFDVLNPYFSISVLHALYSVGSVSYVINNNMHLPWGDLISDDATFRFMNITILSQASILAGYLFVTLNSKWHIQKPKFSITFYNSGALINAMVILLLVSLLLFQRDSINILDVSSYADRVLLDNIQKRNNSMAGISDVITIWAQMSIVCIAFYFVGSDANKLYKIISSLSVFLLLTRYLLAGDRASAVVIIFAIVAFLNYFVYRVGVFLTLLMSLIGYAAFNLMSIMRNSSNIFTMTNLAIDYYRDNGLAMFSLGRSGELIAGSNLLKIINEIDFGSASYLYGMNFIDSIMTFIPRAFYYERIGFGNERFVRDFYPDVYASGGGHGYFLPMDGFWDFGILGVVVLMFFYSSVCGWLYLNFKSKLNSTITCLLYSLFFSQGIIFAMRSGIYASIKQFLIYSFPVFVFYFVFSKLKLRVLTSSEVTPT